MTACLRFWPSAMRGRAAAWALLLALAGLLGAAPARAEGVELTHLSLQRLDPGLTLDFSARVALPRVVEDALQRGVPLYFVAEATVYRHRWYWRDARVARATRSWRLSYQPLSDSWRVSLGGLAQSHATLQEAVTALSSSARWKIADNSQIEPDERYYVEFSYKLDTSQLPGPMQFGIGGHADWVLGVERVVKVE
ncbi:DUF4390 domain-containing protein [Ideonella sp. BN130291]|uniref:DUF4390 domain-containing protein n=1 Tax=Ideonella sp. BN130291 TaxID=3112940 RepID=UPI002E273385|nr:DUF4390 domain-containing protein [Ideonella sp. BN130291]